MPPTQKGMGQIEPNLVTFVSCNLVVNVSSCKHIGARCFTQSWHFLLSRPLYV